MACKLCLRGSLQAVPDLKKVIGTYKPSASALLSCRSLSDLPQPLLGCRLRPNPKAGCHMVTETLPSCLLNLNLLNPKPGFEAGFWISVFETPAEPTIIDSKHQSKNRETKQKHDRHITSCFYSNCEEYRKRLLIPMREAALDKERKPPSGSNRAASINTVASRL